MSGAKTVELFELSEWTDEINPDGNGPSLDDCAQFIVKGDPASDWPGAGPLAKSGTTHHVSHRVIEYRQVLKSKAGDLFIAEPHPPHETVAIAFGEGRGWNPDDIFTQETIPDDVHPAFRDTFDPRPALVQALTHEDCEAGEWLAFERCGERGGTYLFEMKDGKPSLTSTQTGDPS